MAVLQLLKLRSKTRWPTTDQLQVYRGHGGYRGTRGTHGVRVRCCQPTPTGASFPAVLGGIQCSIGGILCAPGAERNVQRRHAMLLGGPKGLNRALGQLSPTHRFSLKANKPRGEPSKISMALVRGLRALLPLRGSVRSFSGGVALPRLPGEPEDDHAGKVGGTVCKRRAGRTQLRLRRP